jgi:hypothetical protein
LVLTTATIGEIPVGTMGTVVHIYEKGKAYEVEFVTDDSNIVETLLSNEIKRK